MRPEPVDAARTLVAERFPTAIQAWLGGSASRGQATATSDLDITVLLADTTVRRESVTWQGWPVELFINTETSVRHFVAKDLARRRPTMARLVGAGLALLDGGGGQQLADECAGVLAAGPGPISVADLEMRRYMLTDTRDDLLGEPPGAEGNAVAVTAWQQSIDLLLALGGAWTGSSKWLVRQLVELDAARGTDYAESMDVALSAALAGDRKALVELVSGILDEAGGPLWAGFAREAVLPGE